MTGRSAEISRNNFHIIGTPVLSLVGTDSFFLEESGVTYFYMNGILIAAERQEDEGIRITGNRAQINAVCLTVAG